MKNPQGGEPCEGGDLAEDDSLLSEVYLELYGGGSPLDALKKNQAQSDEFIQEVRVARIGTQPSQGTQPTLGPRTLMRIESAANTVLSRLAERGKVETIQATCRNSLGERIAINVTGTLAGPAVQPFEVSL